MFVVLWAAALAALAIAMPAIERAYDDLLGLALGMSGLVGGPLLAGFVLSWIPGERGARGYLWSAPLGLLTVLFGIWHGEVAYATSWWVVGLFLLLWVTVGLPRRRQPHASIQTLWLAFTLFLLTRLAEVGDFDDGRSIAWPWYVPVGSTMTLLYAYLLEGPSASSEPR